MSEPQSKKKLKQEINKLDKMGVLAKREHSGQAVYGCSQEAEQAEGMLRLSRAKQVIVL